MPDLLIPPVSATMVVEEAESLSEYRQLLKDKLADCFTRKNDLNPNTTKFARRGITREIFEESTLEHLFGLLLQGGGFTAAPGDSVDLTRIAKNIRGTRTSLTYCNVLATLLYSRCLDKSLQKFLSDILQIESHKPIADNDLPLTQEEACKAFGDQDGYQFWEDQYVFCPVVLKENDESIYVDNRAFCPMPFIEDPVEIGRGAYGVIRKVTIEDGYLVNERDKIVHGRKQYAQKEFFGYDAKAREDCAAERATMIRLIQAPKSHKNILRTRASLELGNEYSLFFDLAKMDLWKYFIDTDITINDVDQKAKIFGRTIGLAGALAFLHEELYLDPTNEQRTSEQLQCYHLDLKPQNILVFEVEGNDIWKITDFGISRIKTVPHGRPESALEHSLDKFLKPKKNMDLSSGIENARSGGTYAAPEAREVNDIVTRKSDVWSLGCVLALVLTFLDSQSSGIYEFQKARGDNREIDWFFDSEALKTKSDDRKILHSSVSDWLEALTKRASSRSKAESIAIQKASKMLRDRLLIRDHIQRLSAKQVLRELRNIHSYFTDQSLQRQAADAPPQPKRTRRFPRPNLLSRLTKQDSKPTARAWHEWHFKLFEVAKRCKFSSNGNRLAIVSSATISVKSTTDIENDRPGITQKSPNGKACADFSLGSNRLCVAVNSDYFKCSFFTFSTGPDSDKELFQNISHIEKKSESAIRSVALSPDDELAAFLHEYNRQGKENPRITLYRIQDMIDQSTSSTTNNSSYTGSDQSTVSQTLDTALKNKIRQPQQLELPPTEGVVELKFCSNSKILIAVTKRYTDEASASMLYSILTWDAINGTRMSCIDSRTKGSDDLGDFWKVRSLAIFAKQPSFVTISRRRIRIGTYNPPKYDVLTHILGDELLNVLVDEAKNQLVLICRSDGRGRIKAFKVDVDKVKDLESLGHGVTMGVEQYDPLRDACCIREKSDGRVLLVASMDTKKQKGKVCQIPLDEIK